MYSLSSTAGIDASFVSLPVGKKVVKLCCGCCCCDLQLEAEVLNDRQDICDRRVQGRENTLEVERSGGFPVFCLVVVHHRPG